MPYAYLRPSHFHYPPGRKIDRPVQTDWFEAACNAFYQLHLQGIYFYGIAFDRFTPNENQSTNLYGWLGTPSATAIARCFARPHERRARRPVRSTGRSRGRLDVPARRPHATHGEPGARRSPRAHGRAPLVDLVPDAATFCVEVDLGGDVVTETVRHVVRAGCTSTTRRSSRSPARRRRSASPSTAQGNAFSFDGVELDRARGVDSVALTSVSCAPGDDDLRRRRRRGRRAHLQRGTWSRAGVRRRGSR